MKYLYTRGLSGRSRPLDIAADPDGHSKVPRALTEGKEGRKHYMMYSAQVANRNRQVIRMCEYIVCAA